MIEQKIVDAWFRQPEIGAEQAEANREVLTAAKIFAETLNKHVPDGDGKANQIQQLRGICLSAELEIRNNWPQPKPVIFGPGRMN
jgi:hypothetical protein